MSAPLPGGFGAQRKARFLKRLAEDGLVSFAAIAAGIQPGAAQRAIDPDHAEYDAAFAEGWAEAMETAADRLEREAWRRAVEGVSEPVIRGGQQVGEIVKHSDALLVRLLQARRPERFGARPKEEQGPIQVILTGDDANL